MWQITSIGNLKNSNAKTGWFVAFKKASWFVALKKASWFVALKKAGWFVALKKAGWFVALKKSGWFELGEFIGKWIVSKKWCEYLNGPKASEIQSNNTIFICFEKFPKLCKKFPKVSKKFPKVLKSF